MSVLISIHKLFMILWTSKNYFCILCNSQISISQWSASESFLRRLCSRTNAHIMQQTRLSWHRPYTRTMVRKYYPYIVWLAGWVLDGTFSKGNSWFSPPHPHHPTLPSWRNEGTPSLLMQSTCIMVIMHFSIIYLWSDILQCQQVTFYEELKDKKGWLMVILCGKLVQDIPSVTQSKEQRTCKGRMVFRWAETTIGC